MSDDVRVSSDGMRGDTHPGAPAFPGVLPRGLLDAYSAGAKRLHAQRLVSVGVDLVHIPSFAEQLESPSAFRGVFTPRERRESARSPHEVASLAARWAAKEALVKAWSSALYGLPPPLADTPEVFASIEVVSDAWKRPALRVHGDVAAACERDFPGARFLLSLSHDGDYAHGLVALTVP